jgi:hypothetical protein
VAPQRAAAVAPPADSLEQREAQKSWCEYLDALHRRAASPTAALPNLQKCMEARTFAAPKMLRQTAKCSREALDQFEGDPFTREYASAVARCGSAALDACEAPRADLEPFMSTICSSVSRCGNAENAECMTLLEGGMKVHLSRAIGAMNERGRDAFQGCLQKLSCDDVGSQVVACLEPIMDGLLWLPE